MRCAWTGGHWVLVLFSIACTRSPESPSSTPGERTAPRASAAPQASSTPNDSWAEEENFEDRDRDQIADRRDRCPDEPERYNGFEDNDGCPDRGNVGYYGGEERIFITFEEQRAEREPEKLRMVLDEVVKLLATNQNITLLEVGGHAETTEEKGPRQQLSKRRADFVKRLLLDRGVHKTRLTSRGYGSDCPLLKDAELELDRALNRRITFRILETTSGPRERTGCPNEGF